MADYFLQKISATASNYLPLAIGNSAHPHPPMAHPGYPGYLPPGYQTFPGYNPQMAQPGYPPTAPPGYPPTGPPPGYPPVASSGYPSMENNGPSNPLNNPMGNQIVVIGSQFCSPYPMELTISRKFSFTEGNFGVTDINGNILFSIKGKVFSIRDRRVLLDVYGNPLVSLQQKILTAHRRWQVYKGDSNDSKNLLFSVKKSSMIQLLKTGLEVFLASNTSEHSYDFKVKGSYLERSCTIYASNGTTCIAQMHRKHSIESILLGKDQFAVTVYPNVDYAFIVALVVILEEINQDRNGED